MSDNQADERLLPLVGKIVAAHAKHSRISTDDLPDLIRLVHKALTGLSGLGAEAVPEQPPVPAVPIRRSVFPDYIVCLEDGKRLRMLKRHLSSAYGLTPDDYRKRWGLPYDYPMVAPSYAAHRSTLAKVSGLGRRPAKGLDGEVPVQPIAEGVLVQRIAEGKRGKRPARTKAAAE